MDARKAGSFNLLAGVSYESSGQTIAFPSSPVQVGFVVPARTQLIFQAHLHNPGTSDLEACSTIDLLHGQKVTAALSMRTVLPEAQYSLIVPAHGSTHVTYEEPVGGHYRIVAASSHMHEGGKYFRMSIKELNQTLYETTNWAAPEPTVYTTQKIVADDAQMFRLECSFENDGASDQHFPDQMCVGAMYLLPCDLPGAC